MTLLETSQGLRAKGKGYQTRINAILREAMAKEEG
jgi:uncharacterized protein (DUF4415 family)